MDGCKVGGVMVERGGIFGVGLLFMITGFLAALNLDNKDAFSYIKKRIVRLWPTYACCILITSLTLFLFWPEKKPSIIQFLLNFTMIQKLFGISGVDGVYWTLSVQLLFYAFIAFVIWKKLKRMLPSISCVWLLLAITLSIFKRLEINNGIIKLASLLFASDYIAMLIIGMIFALLYEGTKVKQIGLIIVLSVINQILALGIINAGLFVINMLLMFLVVRNIQPPKIIANKAVLYFASISYPFYLLHCKIGYVIIRALKYKGITTEWSLVIPFIMILILSSIVHQYIEKPSSQLIKIL